MVVTSSSSALSLCQGLAVEECPRDTSIRNGLGSPLCPLFNRSFMLKIRCVFDDKLGLALAYGSSQCLVGYLAVGQVASSRLRARVSVRAGGTFTVTITMADPTDWVCRILLVKRPRNRRHTNVRNTPHTPPPPPENSVQPSHHQPLLYITSTQAITRIPQIVWLGGGGGVACATHATKRSHPSAVASQKLQHQTCFLPREIKSSEQVHTGNTKRWHARAEAAHNFPSPHQASWLPAACTHSIFFSGPTLRLRRPKIAYTIFVARRSPILSSSPEDRLHSPQPCCWSFSDLPRPRPRQPSLSQ